MEDYFLEKIELYSSAVSLHLPSNRRWHGANNSADSAPDANKSPVVVNGTTFDMRSVYISFGSMSAYAGRRQGRVGYPHSGGVIAIPSSEVYSVGWWTKTHREPADVNTAYFSFNFADLNLYVTIPHHSDELLLTWAPSHQPTPRSSLFRKHLLRRDGTRKQLL